MGFLCAKMESENAESVDAPQNTFEMDAIAPLKLFEEVLVQRVFSKF